MLSLAKSSLHVTVIFNKLYQCVSKSTTLLVVQFCWGVPETYPFFDFGKYTSFLFPAKIVVAWWGLLSIKQLQNWGFGRAKWGCYVLSWLLSDTVRIRFVVDDSYFEFV